uniref:Secreted protein n=1 Tax=Amphimedon queenslandica TaxID=400682 RepID=A0A1X7SSC1_AMPQE
MWFFATVLPLLISDAVPYEDEHWRCYLLLLEITKYSTARVVSSSSAEYLELLVMRHHEPFRICYPQKPTPKIHYMVHFPTLFLKLGPLISCWCMRMEAKNSYFKRISQIGKFKNLSLSVTNRHQKLMCSYLHGPVFDFWELESGPCESFKITAYL